MPRHTSLYDWHKKMGARLVDFAGWEMPIQYKSIVQEHLQVRKSVGLFDISHMGQVRVTGPKSLDFLQKLCTNNVARLKPGKAQYSHLCKTSGGIIDDIFVYCLGPSQYLIVVNAATIEKDYSWMSQNKWEGVFLENQSDRYAMVAVQGPNSVSVMSRIFASIPGRNQCLELDYGKKKVILCRTGYTGEDGLEILFDPAQTEELISDLMKKGQKEGITPCGLGSRDTLRLESGYMLYGHDIDEDHTPLEAGLAWVVKFDKGDFIGRNVLLKQKETGTKQQLKGFKLTERGIPRAGAAIKSQGKPCGVVTSGTFSPTLNVGIAMGYIPKDSQEPFSIECLGKSVPAAIVPLPFYKKPSPVLQAK